jgi:hypothetical protein
LEKKRSITAFQLLPNPFTLVKTETRAMPVSAGSISISMSPDPTTPTRAFLVTRRFAEGYSKSSCSMSLLLFAIVFAYFILLTFDSIQKDRRSQQVGASTGRNMFRNELAVERVQPVSPWSRGASTGSENGSRARLHKIQGLDTATIENARVVKLAHNAEQRVQTADFL